MKYQDVEKTIKALQKKIDKKFAQLRHSVDTREQAKLIAQLADLKERQDAMKRMRGPS